MVVYPWSIDESWTIIATWKELLDKNKHSILYDRLRRAPYPNGVTDNDEWKAIARILSDLNDLQMFTMRAEPFMNSLDFLWVGENYNGARNFLQKLQERDKNITVTELGLEKGDFVELDNCRQYGIEEDYQLLRHIKIIQESPHLRIYRVVREGHKNQLKSMLEDIARWRRQHDIDTKNQPLPEGHKYWGRLCWGIWSNDKNGVKRKIWSLTVCRDEESKRRIKRELEERIIGLVNEQYHNEKDNVR
ncbi:hypothetical protein MANI_024373 [Metarhizium anisopliae]|nr:hypothetical protein MANI_024373 [Metarhizium anisopliae]